MSQFSFILAALVSPILICFALYRVLKDGDIAASGTLGSKLRVTLTGPMAAWAVLSYGTLYFLAPDALSSELELHDTSWSYKVAERDEKLGAFSGRSGVLQFWRSDDGLLQIREVGDAPLELADAIGFENRGVVFLRLTHSETSDIVALGRHGKDLGRLRLRLYNALPDGTARDAKGVVSHLSLKRSWPYDRLFILILLPLLCFGLLHVIGKSSVKVEAEGNAGPGLLSRLGEVRIQAEGAIGGYFLVFATIAFLARTAQPVDPESVSTCSEDLAGDWVFKLFHENRLDNIGQFHVECLQGETLRLSGTVRSTRTPLGNTQDCYAERPGPDARGPTYSSFRTTVAVLRERLLLAVYQVEGGGDMGFLYGSVAPGLQGQTWTFADLEEATSDEETADKVKDHGRLVASPSKTGEECSQLCKRHQCDRKPKPR